MKKLGLFFTLLLILIIVSCEIGLGSSVDTEVPTISIENPPNLAKIRDPFVIDGRWSDDGSISDLSIVLKSTSSETSVEYKFTGTLEYEFQSSGGKGTWYVLIDPETAGIKDGKYEATVTITDAMGHKTITNRSFTIDNTPPVVVISRPSSIKDSEDSLVESYGQYITLTGEAADDNDIGNIKITFYDAENPEKGPWSTTLTGVSSKIDNDIAKFSKTFDEANIYSQIYGTNPDGGYHKYYCTIESYDSTKRYPPKGQEKEDDALGNKTETYLLDDDLQDFNKENSALCAELKGENQKLKVKDLYAIRAGNSQLTSDRSIENKVASKVAELFENKSVSEGSLKLNPKNNPSFSVSGLELGEITNVENERALTVQLSKGLDGIKIDRDSLKVYLIPVMDPQGNTIENADKIYLSDDDAQYEKKGDGQFLATIRKKQDVNDPEKDLVYRTIYIIGVEGEDIEGNKMEASLDGSNKDYRICLKAKNIPPELTITKPEDTIWYTKKGDSVVIEGTTSVPDGQPILELRKNGSKDSIWTYTVSESDLANDSEDDWIKYNFSVTIPDDTTGFAFSEEKTDKYVFEIVSTLEESSSSASKTIVYDIDPPTIQNYSLTSAYDAGLKDGIKTYYIDNRETPFTLTGIAKDNLEIGEVSLTIKDENGTTLKQLTTTDSVWTLESNSATEAWTDNWKTWTNYVTAIISAKDKAGNETIAPKDFRIIFDTEAPVSKHCVDTSGKDLYFRIGEQSNDDIDSTSSLWNEDLDKDVGGKYKSGTFGNKETIKIRGNFEDGAGSGVKMIYYKLYTHEPTTTEIQSFLKNYESQALSESGVGYFSPLAVPETKRIFYADKSASGDLNDGTLGNKIVPAKKSDNSPDIQNGKFYTDIVSTYKTMITGFTAGHNHLALVAVDNVGHAAIDSVSSYCINVDTQAPETLSAEDVFTDGSADLQLAFTVNDKPDGQNAVSAGVNKVSVKMESLAEIKSATLDTTFGSPTNGKWVVTIPVAELPSTSGSYAVSVTAVDGAGEGNSDTRTVCNVIVDKDPPEISNVKFEEVLTSSSKDVSQKNDYYYVNNTQGKQFRVSGVATDNRGVKSISLDVINTAANSTASLPNQTLTNPAQNWNFTVGDWSSWTTGATLVITATDKAGLTSSQTLNIAFDTVAPTVSTEENAIIVPNPSQTENSMFKFEGAAGSLSDAASGLDKVEIAFTSDNTEPTAAQATVTPSSNGSWSSTVEFANAAFGGVFNTQGTKYLWVKAYDKAGNASAWTPKSFKYDTAAPEVSFTDVTPVANSYRKEGFKLEVNASDSYGVDSVTVSYGTETAVPLTLNTETGKYEKSFRVDSEPGDATHLDDGKYTFTVHVTDKSGKSSEAVITFSIDTILPTGSFAENQAGTLADGKLWFKSSSVRFAVNVTDANIDTVEITKDGSIDDPMTLSSGSYSATLTELSEGENTITVKMKDHAGNENTTSTVIYVDTTEPSLNVNASSVLKYMGSGGFTVDGTVGDSGSGVATLTVTEEYSEDNVNFEATSASGAAVEFTGNNWTKHLPLGASTTPENGYYRYKFILKDKAGNSAEYSTNTTVDIVAPSLSFINPTGRTGVDSINASPYMFSGSINEANEIKAIYYKILDITADEPSAPTANIIYESTWTNAGWTSITAEENWSFYRDINSGTNAIAEGKYKIYMYVLDGAGNLSTRASQEFHVDMAAPVVTAETAEYVNYGTNTDHGRKVTISGTVEETHGLLSFIIKRNDETGNGTSVTPALDGSWSYENTPATDGTYTYTIIATDLVGKTNTTLAKTVKVDITSPEVSSDQNKFTVPVGNQTENTIFKFEGASGSVSDGANGTGLDSVGLLFKGSDETPEEIEAAQVTVTPSATGIWSCTVEFASDVFGSEFDEDSQGTKYMWIRAYDKAGNTSGWQLAKTFVYDMAAPSVEFAAATPAVNSFNREGFKLEVSAEDTYGVQSVTAAYGNQNEVILGLNAETGKYEKLFRVGTEAGEGVLLADGTYNFTVTVTDLAGKISEVTRTFSVDTTLPEGAFGASTPAGTVVEGNTWYKSSSIRFAVNVTEVNIDTVEISKDGTTFEPMIGSAGSYSATLTELTEGEKTITVRMKDYAGNENTVTKTVNIDTTNPSLDVNTASVLKYMSSTGFTVSGSTGDSGSGVASLTVTEEHSTDKVSYTATEASGTSGVIVALNGSSWTRHLPLGDGEPENGYYRYKFVLKDNAGNSAEYVTNTTVDKALPELTITNPAANAKTGTNAINSTPYQFSGSISEANEIKAIYYKILALSDTTASTTAPASDLLDETVWTGAGWTAVTAEENWSFYRNINSGEDSIAEGKYKIYMYALDGAGNLSDSNSATASISEPYSQEFHVDMAAPVVSAETSEYVNYATNTDHGRKVTISGNVIETHGLLSFIIKRNDESGNGTSVTPAADGSWNYENTPAADGTYTYIFTATDKVGKTNTTLTKTVIVDTAVPTVTNDTDKFTVPTASQTEGNLFKFEGSEGSVNDGTAGSGLDKVELLFTDTASTPVAAATVQASVTPGTDGTWAYTVEFASSAFGTVFNAQGTKYLWVRVYDKAGNTSAWTLAKSFVYDKAVPSISFTDTSDNKNPAAGSYRKEGFTLEAVATDTYGVQKVEVLYGDQTVQMSLNEESGKYEKAFKVGSETTANAVQLADGDYTFTVKVTDLAGKTNSVARSLSVDTTVPEIDMDNTSVTRTADYTATNNVGWHKTEQIPVTVSVTDTGSGISTVQISTDTNFTNPTSLMQSTSGWTGIIVCDDQGTNTIYIKATDAVGNTTTVNTTYALTVFVDTLAPEEPVFLGAGLSDTSMIPASEITSVLVNKESNLTVYGALADSEDSEKSTGIATSAAFQQKGKSGTSANVAFNALPTAIKNSISAWQTGHAYETGDVVNYSSKAYICKTAHTSAASFASANWKEASLWKYTIPTADMISGGINFIVKDNVGNTLDYNLFQMVVDDEPPTVTFKDIDNLNLERGENDNTVYVNGTIVISGSASDNQKLASLKVEYQKHDTSTWTEIPAPENASLTSWSRTIDTTTLDDESEYDIRVSATDEAGNSTDNSATSTTLSSRTKSIKVSQDTDRPIIKFSNLDLSDVPTTTAGMSANNRVSFSNVELYGSISDDDGTPRSLSYYYGTNVPTDNDYIPASTTANPTNLKYSNGSFTLKFKKQGNKNDDGPHNLYFKVIDASGTTGRIFTTKDATTYDATMPKLIDSSEGENPKKYGYKLANNATTTTVTYIKVDTLEPYRGNLQFSTDNGTTWQDKADISARPFGGTTRNTFKIRVPAFDDNGVQSVLMEVKTSAEAQTAEQTITFTEGDEISSGSESYNQSYPNAKYWNATINIPSNMESGSKACTIKVSDGVKENNYDFTIIVDNTHPVISVTSPSSTQYSCGSIPAVGETDLNYWKNTAASDTPREFMYYALSLDDSTVPAADYEHRSSETEITTWKDENDEAGASSCNYIPYYTPIQGGSYNWYVYLDGGTTSANESHDVTLKQFLINSGVTTEAAISSKAFTTKVKAYLWIKAVDQVGLETVIKHPILIDPQGDAPSVTIDYPEEAGTTLGGSVSLRGIATDTIGSQIGVDSVWVQIISSINNGYDSSEEASLTTGTRTAGGLKFVDTVTSTVSGNNITYSHAYTLNSFAPKIKDVKQWIEKGYQVYTNITTIDNASTTDVTEGPTAVTSVTGEDSDDGSAYFIKANFSGSAWNLKINDHAEFNPGTGKLNPIAYRVFAKDKDGNLSNYEQQLSVYDSDNPVVSELYLRQFSDNENGDGTVTASRPFEDNIWVKGTWWLCGKVKDTQGLSKLEVGPASDKTNQNPSGEAGAAETFKCKLNTGSDFGSLTIVVEASDNATPKHTITPEYVINYDNTAPELVTSGTQFNINSSVKNSNGFYSFGSLVKEEPVGTKAQSGFDYLAFWFERNITDKHVVYDVMRQKTKIVEDETTYPSEVQYSSLTSDSGLMWKSLTVGRSEESLGTLTIANADSNIHVGGLCKIGGSIFFISSISSDGKTINIDGQPEYSTDSDTALFAIANVVNNNIESGSGSKSTDDGLYGYYSYINNDDHDHMVESVSKAGSGTSWAWEANINSQNMADGIIVLHYVAFDKAGNYKEGSVTGNVENNAPRLASLEVWSDFNENNTKDAGEYKTSYYKGKERKVGGVTSERATALTSELVVSGNDKDYILAEGEEGTAFMTVKATTRFTPEIVGGNGALYYTYKYGDKDSLATANIKYAANTIGNGTDDGIDEEKDSEGYYKLDDQNENAYIVGHKNVYMEIPGKLETETTDTYSLNALGNSETGPTWFEYTIYDSTEGSSSTWNATTHDTTGRLSAKFRVALNLKYQDTTSPVVKIRPFYWNSKTDNSVSWTTGTDPIAEGHIELEGDLPSSFTTGGSGVNDRDPKVSGVIKIEGYAFDDIKLKELYVQMSNHTNLASRTTPVSTYNGTWTQTAYSSTTGWGFSATDVFCNGDGHLVKWTLTVDTAMRTVPAQADQTVVVYAVDARGSETTNTSVHNGTTQTTLVQSSTWEDVKEETTSVYFTDYNCSTKATSSTADSTVVYKGPTLWGNVKGLENALTTYYTDFWCNTKVTTSTADTTVVYREDELENMTYYYKMDIVPYITGVETKLSSLKRNNPSVYDRTALGHYPVSDTETVTFSGFNLTGAKYYNATNENWEDLSGTNKNKLDVSNIQSSGKIVLKVGDLYTINNMNNNEGKGSYTGTVNLTNKPTGDKSVYENYYNRMPNGDNNNLLTDDVEFDVWQINSEAGKPTNGPLTQPVMAINPINKQVGFAFTNGPLYFSMGSLDKSYGKWKYGIDFWTSIGFAYDAKGNAYGTAAGGDINGSTDADPFGIFSSKWGNGGITKDAKWHNQSDGWLRLESIGQGEATDAEGKTFTGDNINKERIKSSSIATTVIDATSTNVYLAYYDELNNEIRFKYGKVTTTKGNDGLLADYYGPNGSLRNTKSVQALPYTLEYTSLIAGQTTGKKTFYYDNKNKQQYLSVNTAVMTDEETPHPVCAGQYVSIAAKYQGGQTYNTGTEDAPVTFKDDLVVAVWYDATNNQMLYSYNTAPHKIKALSFKGADRTIDSYSQSATGWSTPKAIFGEGNGIGEYCKVAIDGAGKVHIACYDNANADVWYAYLDNYANPDVAKTCIVDSYGIVGTELNLDVALKDNKPVPYISYYGSSCARPKVAYWAGDESIATASTLEGAEDEAFTKSWEVSIIPSSSKISIDHINVGVWKDTSGNITYSTTDGNPPNNIEPGEEEANRGVSEAGNEEGMIYGNGTKNPILGYAITKAASGYIETAQMK